MASGANVTAAGPVENTFNLQDKPDLASIFFVTLMLCHLYVASRLLALRALERQLQLTSTRLKMLVTAFPVTFATMLAVRTSTHALNNACEELVPYSYVIRFLIHISLLCYQLRAFIVLRWFSTFGLPHQRPRRRRCLAASFVTLATPAGVICILMWVLRMGIQLNGVCTVGERDGSDTWLGISMWVWLSEVYELVFILANLATEVRLCVVLCCVVLCCVVLCCVVLCCVVLCCVVLCCVVLCFVVLCCVVLCCVVLLCPCPCPTLSLCVRVTSVSGVEFHHVWFVGTRCTSTAP